MNVIVKVNGLMCFRNISVMRMVFCVVLSSGVVFMFRFVVLKVLIVLKKSCKNSIFLLVLSSSISMKFVVISFMFSSFIVMVCRSVLVLMWWLKSVVLCCLCIMFYVEVMMM